MEVCLDKPYRGKGIGTEACRQLIAHGFEHVGLHRIYAYVRHTNIPSLKLCQKLGMQHEGVLREAIRDEGTSSRIDHHLFSLLSHEQK